jgi:hypothetical protein
MRGDTSIKRREPATVFDGKTEKIDIGNLLMGYSRKSEPPIITKGHSIGPKHMIAGSSEGLEAKAHRDG